MPTIGEMEWEQKTCIKLIEHFKEREMLWNPKHSQYYNKLKKENAWGEISEKLGKSIEELKKKIDSLKGSYRREKSRAKKSIGTGTGGCETYESRWFAYNYFRFLDERDDLKKTVNSSRVVEEQGEREDEGEEEKKEMEFFRSDEIKQEDVTEPEGSFDLNATNVSSVVTYTPPKKRPRERFLDEDPIVTDVHRRDQCSLFGDYIAEKLRVLDNRLRAIAQHQISNVIFEVEMKAYSEPYAQHGDQVNVQSDFRNNFSSVISPRSSDPHSSRSSTPLNSDMPPSQYEENKVF